MRYPETYIFVDYDRKTHSVTVCQPSENFPVLLPRRYDTNHWRKRGRIDPHEGLDIRVGEKPRYEGLSPKRLVFVKFTATEECLVHATHILFRFGYWSISEVPQSLQSHNFAFVRREEYICESATVHWSFILQADTFDQKRSRNHVRAPRKSENQSVERVDPFFRVRFAQLAIPCSFEDLNQGHRRPNKLSIILTLGQ